MAKAAILNVRVSTVHFLHADDGQIECGWKLVFNSDMAFNLPQDNWKHSWQSTVFRYIWNVRFASACTVHLLDTLAFNVRTIYEIHQFFTVTFDIYHKSVGPLMPFLFYSINCWVFFLVGFNIRFYTRYSSGWIWVLERLFSSKNEASLQWNCIANYKYLWLDSTKYLWLIEWNISDWINRNSFNCINEISLIESTKLLWLNQLEYRRLAAINCMAIASFVVFSRSTNVTEVSRTIYKSKYGEGGKQTVYSKRPTELDTVRLIYGYIM